MNFWSEKGNKREFWKEKWLKLMKVEDDPGCSCVKEGLQRSKTGLTAPGSSIFWRANEVTRKYFIFQDKTGSFQISEWQKEILKEIKYHEIREIEQMRSVTIHSNFSLIRVARSWSSEKGTKPSQAEDNQWARERGVGSTPDIAREASP